MIHLITHTWSTIEVKKWEKSYEIFVINQDGDWSGIAKPPNLYITYDDKDTKIEILDSVSFIPKKEEIYNNFTSKKDQIFIIPDFGDVVVPDQSIVEINVTDKNDKEIQDLIDNTLSSGFGSSNDKNDKVVVIKDPIEFVSNKVYNDNEWTKFTADSKITLEGGNLNVVLPDDGETTIAIKNTDNIYLKINGNGTLKLESTDQTKTKYEIKGKSTISGETTIIVPEGSTSVKIDSIDLTETGITNVRDTSYNNVPLTVDSIQSRGIIKQYENRIFNHYSTIVHC